MPDEPIELWQFTRKHPECEHCGEILAAITNWAQKIHDTCPCVCHVNKTTVVRQEAKSKKRRKK